jgi:toxin-antitoxin system PIN domain toxin
MIILDVNVLLYAYNLRAPQHQKVSDWLRSLFLNVELIGLPWATLWGFIRILTNPRLSPNPASAEEAFHIVRKLLANPNVRVVEPGPRHAELLAHLVIEHRATGPLLSDAVLAALALENGASLASCDQDFSRFTGVRWINPLS